jgi:hypothetical protein
VNALTLIASDSPGAARRGGKVRRVEHTMIATTVHDLQLLDEAIRKKPMTAGSISS